MTTQRTYASPLAIAALSLLLTACAGAASNRGRAGAPTIPTLSPSEHDNAPGNLQAPPPVTLRFFEQSIELHPWTYCYGSGCADGVPPRDPPHVGDPEEVLVQFPLSGWSFKASFTPAGEKCGRRHDARLEPRGDGEFVLQPAGYANTYDVTLFGRGNGDLVVTFRWTTPTDGPLAVPEARLSVLADHDGQVDSYGVELEVTNLARTPRRVAATITVTSREGESLAFRARRSRRGCWPEGTVYWDGPDDKGLAAARLGKPPFTYKVELLLDGTRYVATATWPDDEIKGYQPSVALDFTPDLPALSDASGKN